MSNESEKNEFTEEANDGEQHGLISEFFDFIKENKKFWMIPILFALLVLGALLILGGTSAAPFIYTLF